MYSEQPEHAATDTSATATADNNGDVRMDSQLSGDKVNNNGDGDGERAERQRDGDERDRRDERDYDRDRDRDRDRRQRSPPPPSAARRESRAPEAPRRPPGAPIPEPTNVLGVFGLSIRTQERDLEDEFSRHGDVDKVVVVYDQRSQRSRGFGFVTMRTVEDAERAIANLNGIDLHGRRLRVDFSATTRPHDPTPGMYKGSKRDDEWAPRDRYAGGGGGGAYGDRWAAPRRDERYGGGRSGGYGRDDRYGGGSSSGYGRDRDRDDRYGGGRDDRDRYRDHSRSRSPRRSSRRDSRSVSPRRDTRDVPPPREPAAY